MLRVSVRNQIIRKFGWLVIKRIYILFQAFLQLLVIF